MAKSEELRELLTTLNMIKEMKERVELQIARKRGMIATAKVDNRGRVCVRAALSRDIGLAPGQPAFLYGGVKGFVVSSVESPTRTNYLGSLKVDKDRNIRISRYIQNKARSLSDSFEMGVAVNSIFLRA